MDCGEAQITAANAPAAVPLRVIQGGHDRSSQQCSSRRITSPLSSGEPLKHHTDTWFEGGGPKLAKRGKTKEGMVKRKIGIVLLCDAQGHPPRWEVVQGTAAEGPQMLQIIRTAQQIPWLEQTPNVCDRAMGHTAYIRELLDAGVQFITASSNPEFGGYGVQFPSEVLAELPAPRMEDELEACAARALERARQTELKELSEDLFCTALGMVEVPVNETEPRDVPSLCSEALRIGLALLESVACRKHSTHAAATRAQGLGTEQGHQYRLLARDALAHHAGTVERGG